MKVQMANAASRKTREAIRRAFAELISEKGALNKITVTELVTRAGVTRGTFYTHYDNIYQVAVEFEDEVMEVAGLREKRPLERGRIEEYFDMVFGYIKDNEYVYRTLAGSDAPLMFLSRLNRQLQEKILELLAPTEENRKKLTLDVTFYVDGVVCLLFRYLRDEVKLTLEDVKEYALTRAQRMMREY